MQVGNELYFTITLRAAIFGAATAPNAANPPLEKGEVPGQIALSFVPAYKLKTPALARLPNNLCSKRRAKWRSI